VLLSPAARPQRALKGEEEAGTEEEREEQEREDEDEEREDEEDEQVEEEREDEQVKEERADEDEATLVARSALQPRCAGREGSSGERSVLFFFGGLWTSSSSSLSLP